MSPLRSALACATQAYKIKTMSSTRRHFLTSSTSLLTGIATWAYAGASRAQSAPASEAKAPPLPAVGSLLRLPEVPLLDGTVFRPAQAEGQVLVIYWWASTCPFCTLQSPEIQKLWGQHQARGLQLLTLSVDKKPQDAQAYLRKNGYTFPAGFVTPDIQRVLPKPRGLPVTLVRGRDGRIVQAEKGQLFPEDVEQLARWL